MTAYSGFDLHVPHGALHFALPLCRTCRLPVLSETRLGFLVLWFVIAIEFGRAPLDIGRLDSYRRIASLPRVLRFVVEGMRDGPRNFTEACTNQTQKKESCAWHYQKRFPAQDFGGSCRYDGVPNRWLEQRSKVCNKSPTVAHDAWPVHPAGLVFSTSRPVSY